MKSTVVFFFLCTFGAALLQKRLRRQTIPSDHIKIDSTTSQVSMDRLVNVVSSDSRIQIFEKNFKGSFWSSSSKIQFDLYDTFANATFDASYFNLNVSQCEYMHGFSPESEFYITSDRKLNEEMILYKLYDNANLTIDEEGTELEGLNAEYIEINSRISTKNIKKEFFVSASKINNIITVKVTINSPFYTTIACFVNATLRVKFGNNLIRMSPDLQNIDIYNGVYHYQFHSNNYDSMKINFASGFLKVSNEEEGINFVIDQYGVTVHVDSSSITNIERKEGLLFLSGKLVKMNNVTLQSSLLTLHLYNSGILHADSDGSELLLNSSAQKVSLTGHHQEIQIAGGVCGVVIETGSSYFNVSKHDGISKWTSDFYLPQEYADVATKEHNYTSDFPRPDTFLPHIELTEDCHQSVTSSRLTSLFSTTVQPNISGTNTAIQMLTTTNYVKNFVTENSQTLQTPTLTTSLSNHSTWTESPNSSTVAYPTPHEMSTNDFVFGHWFTTEKTTSALTVDSVELAMTLSLDENVFNNNLQHGSTELPPAKPLNINSDFTPKLFHSTTETSGMSMPETSDISKTEPKMLVLKLKVPNDVNIASKLLFLNMTTDLTDLLKQSNYSKNKLAK